MITDKYPEDKKTLLGQDYQQWRPLLPASKLKPHSLHTFKSKELGNNNNVISHVRVKMFPDGGISRVRIMGTPAK